MTVLVLIIGLCSCSKPASEPEPEEPEPEEPSAEPESVAIKAKGEIVKWGENPAVFKIDGGGTLELDIKDAEISGGYIPKIGDQVVILYDKDKMKLFDLELEYRPVEAKTAESTEDKEEAETTDAGKDDAPAAEEKKDDAD